MLNTVEPLMTAPYIYIKHEKIHTREKPYKYNEYRKAFSYNLCLSQHQKMYNAEKYYNN
jgi:KRAB domain-containing zinc finger protein